MELSFTLTGEVPRDRVARAIQLSRDVCSVWHWMRPDIELATSFEVIRATPGAFRSPPEARRLRYYFPTSPRRDGRTITKLAGFPTIAWDASRNRRLRRSLPQPEEDALDGRLTRERAQRRLVARAWSPRRPPRAPRATGRGRRSGSRGSRPRSGARACRSARAATRAGRSARCQPASSSASPGSARSGRAGSRPRRR